MPPRRGPHGPHGGPPMEKAKDFKGTVKKLVKYMSKYKFAVIMVGIFAIGSTIFNIVGPKILSKATTEIFNGLVSKISGGDGIDFEKIGQIIMLVMGIYVLSAAFNFFQSWIMSGVSQKMTYNMRKEISEKIHRIPMKYYESNTHGEVLSRVTNDVDTLGMSLNQSITQLITSVTTIIGVLIMMLSISWLMTLIALIILPISATLVMLVVKSSQKYFKQQQEYLGHVNGQVEEIYGGHLVVKAFNREEKAVEEFTRDNKILCKSAMMSQFLSGMMHPIMQFVGNLGYVSVAVTGAWLAIKGTISVGDIQAFIQYVRQFTQPITQLAQVSNMLQSTAAAAERVFEFLEEEEEPVTGNDPISPAEIKGDVEFKNVNFGSDPNKTIINDFSAKVKTGQTVAIVGPTGAGKTTMVKLLMRFYDVNSGEITVDGHDIREFDRSSLREAFGMVLQDTWLFNGTIM
ncbi:MAG: ABC transporter ATP-binding protein, partial [Oscillospiraceae bacterium]|nr:ABC transporter ATP-binding protein [Oscillospiraceae bacterium]